jgi:hypothetical protein
VHPSLSYLKVHRLSDTMKLFITPIRAASAKAMEPAGPRARYPVALIPRHPVRVRLNAMVGPSKRTPTIQSTGCYHNPRADYGPRPSGKLGYLRDTGTEGWAMKIVTDPSKGNPRGFPTDHVLGYRSCLTVPAAKIPSDAWNKPRRLDP